MHYDGTLHTSVHTKSLVSSELLLPSLPLLPQQSSDGPLFNSRLQSEVELQLVVHHVVVVN